jgi:xylose isomerase
MPEYFPGIPRIAFEGADTRNPLAFRHYNADETILGRTMKDHFRFSVCYWHTFKGSGQDMFGGPTFDRPYASSDPIVEAEMTLQAAFEFFTKLGVGFWCFHDRDIAPEGQSLADTNRHLDRIAGMAKQLQQDTGVRVLWGTANLFAHRRYMCGAATNPDPAVFAYAAAQVKKALEVTHELGGQGYVFWGGREGYETLLNTDMAREQDHYARFLHMAVDYAKRIGFTGQFYIEPKPKEPTKHQYDSDAAACHAFLLKNGLSDLFKLNIEANHATLAGHSFHHELEYASANGILGSIDANRGDTLLGWDTDQFPTDLYDTTQAMCVLLRHGGFRTGGLNFDAKIRRTSLDPEDLFLAHIGGMDAFARGLKIAARMQEDGVIPEFIRQRYAGWDDSLGQRIEAGKATLEELEEFTFKHGEPKVRSAKQEYLENLLNSYI